MVDFLAKSQNGVPSLNFPKLNPLRIPFVQLNPGAESTVQVKMSFRDVDLYGIKNPELIKTVGFDSDPAKSKFEIHVKFNRLEMLSNYNISGRVLILPIVGTGRSNLTFGESNIIICRKKSKLKIQYITLNR